MRSSTLSPSIGTVSSLAETVTRAAIRRSLPIEVYLDPAQSPENEYVLYVLNPVRLVDEVPNGIGKICLVALGRESHPRYVVEYWDRSLRRRKGEYKYSRHKIGEFQEGVYRATGMDQLQDAVQKQIKRWLTLVQVDYVMVT